MDTIGRIARPEDNMPWSARDTMSLREEFVALACQEGANRRELCRRFGISPQTGYKWLMRSATLGTAGLGDASRRPHHSPGETPPELQNPSSRCASSTRMGRSQARSAPE